MERRRRRGHADAKEALKKRAEIVKKRSAPEAERLIGSTRKGHRDAAHELGGTHTPIDRGMTQHVGESLRVVRKAGRPGYPEQHAFTLAVLRRGGRPPRSRAADNVSLSGRDKGNEVGGFANLGWIYETAGRPR